jgi:hypothetical protein
MFPRLCEPTGRANARPMTGSAKQSTYPLAALWIASSQALLAMTAVDDLSAVARRAKADPVFRRQQ